MKIKRKLGIYANCLQGISPINALELIRNAGFECYFLMWTTPEKIAAAKKRGDELGLSCEFIHAPFFDINTMWEEGDAYLRLYNELLTCIKAAGENNVPSVILHLTSGWEPPCVSDVGFSRYDALVEYAAERGVKLAFENMRVLAHVAIMKERYRHTENVGFCFDCGHEHCFTKTIEWMHVFEDRVIATHIHDNFSRGERNADKVDIHLLPFDGTYDYGRMMRQLDEYGIDVPLMLEVVNYTRYEGGEPRLVYPDMTNEEFLATAYERIKRISEM